MSDTPAALAAPIALKALKSADRFLREYEQAGPPMPLPRAVDHVRIQLVRLTELELIDRERRHASSGGSGWPSSYASQKLATSFDFKAHAQYRSDKHDGSGTRRVVNTSSVVKTSSHLAMSGTGKTHIALTAVGLRRLVQKGNHRRNFITADCASWSTKLIEAGDEKRLLPVPSKQLAIIQAADHRCSSASCRLQQNRGRVVVRGRSNANGVRRRLHFSWMTSNLPFDELDRRCSVPSA